MQQKLAAEVSLDDDLGALRYVAGVDVGFEASGQITRAAVALLAFPELTLVEYRIARLQTTMAYIPGLLSFRECPAMIKALEQLQRQPDLVLCDGHGLAHPRGLGVACHLGVLTGLPCIGVAKSRLCGHHGPLAQHKGARVALIYRQQVVGALLRSRAQVRPLYISAGHRISLETALCCVQACLTRYRLPEPIRWADGLASGKPWALKAVSGLSP